MDKNLKNEDLSSLDECIYCHSFCKSSCISFDISGNDCFLPRNISYFYNLLKKGELEASENLVKIFYSCTACSLCEINCVYDNKDFISNIIKIRSETFKNNRNLIPAAVSMVIENLHKTGNIFGAAFKSLKTIPNSLKESFETTLFLGCFINYKVPEIFEDISAFLNKNEIRFNIFHDEPCCGAPLFYAGDIYSAKKIAQEIKDKIKSRNIKRLIMFCPAGYDYMKNWYKKLGIDLETDIIFYTDFLNPVFKNIMQYSNAYLKQERNNSLKQDNNNIMFLEAGEFRNEKNINKSAKEVLYNLKNTSNKELLSDTNFHTNCGGVLNLYNYKDIKKYVNEIVSKYNMIKSDFIVTISPICYYYLKEFGSGIKVRELIGYLSEMFKTNDSK